MARKKFINALLASTIVEAEQRTILDVCTFVEAVTRGVRKNGEPATSHPYNVGALLISKRQPPTVIKSGLLHDVLEDCPVTVGELQTLFGEDVVNLVSGVTVDPWIKAQYSDNYRLRKCLSFHHLLSHALADVRVMTLKLADRLHNLRTIEGLSAEQRRLFAWETLDFIIPAALIVMTRQDRRLVIDLQDWLAEMESIALANYHAEGNPDITFGGSDLQVVSSQLWEQRKNGRANERFAQISDLYSQTGA